MTISMPFSDKLARFILNLGMKGSHRNESNCISLSKSIQRLDVVMEKLCHEILKSLQALTKATFEPIVRTV